MKNLLAASLCCFLWCAGAGAQPAQPDASKPITLARAERLSVELKQGMSADDVKKLLGAPRRTALKTRDYGAAGDGSLQWTYIWTAPSRSERTLQIGFGTRTSSTSGASGTPGTPGEWIVNSWEWSGH